MSVTTVIAAALKALVEGIKAATGKFVTRSRTVIRNGRKIVETTYEWVQENVAPAVTPVVAGLGRAISSAREARADRRAVAEQRAHEVAVAKAGRSGSGFSLSLFGRGGAVAAEARAPKTEAEIKTAPAAPQVSEDEVYAGKVRAAAKRMARDQAVDWSGVHTEHREWLQSLDRRQLEAIGGITRERVVGHLDGSRLLNGVPAVEAVAAAREAKAGLAEARHPRVTGSGLADRLRERQAARRAGQTASLADELRHEPA
ncbi:hypothetical protein CR162_14915 [Pseudoroseomonas rhizosphaerae]|uniref:Uncharacterized protein n=1 Tax=Teichococcus rhizosphaerae TaxID=1335062 RepID=A0A2C7A7T9_9PROT|nr:hypothetical protein [Pseudoroseomonas rhizosphaerae]PHK94059.1 hypothetical protein CR162_14915 [Pseudoroseomonas rhizosphaerae]